MARKYPENTDFQVPLISPSKKKQPMSRSEIATIMELNRLGEKSKDDEGNYQFKMPDDTIPDRPETTSSTPSIPAKPETAAKKNPRAFTNRRGTEAAPGVNWEYVPEGAEPGGGWQKPGGKSTAELTPADLGEGQGFIRGQNGKETFLPGKDQKPITVSPSNIPQKPKPTPSFTYDDRMGWRNDIINEIGFDPERTTVYDVLEEAEDSVMPGMFEQVFQGQVRYEDYVKDPSILDNQERDMWNKQYRATRAEIANMFKADQDVAKQTLKEGMDFWDQEAKRNFDSKAQAGKGEFLDPHAKAIQSQKDWELEKWDTLMQPDPEVPVKPNKLLAFNTNNLLLGLPPYVETKVGKEYHYGPAPADPSEQLDPGAPTPSPEEIMQEATNKGYVDAQITADGRVMARAKEGSKLQYINLK